MSTGAIVVGAGESRRMGGVDKLFVDLGGQPLLAHTLRAFEAAPAVDSVVLVLSDRNLGRGQELARAVGADKVAAIVAGGARRQDSVRAGLQALAPCDVVLVHDAARPLVTPAVIARCVRAAADFGAVIAAIPAQDTVKEVAADGRIERTLDRARIWLAQTPQAFRRAVLERVHAEVQEDVTDDAAMVERLGIPVFVVPGDATNVKITTSADLALAAAILQQRGLTVED